MRALRNYYLDHMSLRLPGDQFDSHDPADTKKDFKFYTMDLSYFSGKLEMYFRYKEIPHERVEPTGKEFNEILYVNTGTEQLPQVYDARASTPESKRWLRDTTPMIEYLEADPQISQYSRSVLPTCPVQLFIQQLVEDYADEYLWRPAMFWRWEPAFDRLIMGHRFKYEFARELPLRYSWNILSIRHSVMSLRQWLLSSYGEDCTTQAKKEVVKNQYYELLDILEEILSKQPYLFGNHPTLVDFGFAGPFFRHFSSDFTPRKVMQQRAPAVYEWVARLWNSKSSKMQEPNGFPAQGTLPANWKRLLGLLPEYLEYSHLNAVAYREGKSTFSWINHGETFTVPVVPYRVWCRMTLQYKFSALQPEIQRQIESILREYNCWELLWQDGVITAPPECGTAPPFALYPPPKERTQTLISLIFHPPLLYKWDSDRIFAGYLALTGLKILSATAAIGAAWLISRNKRPY